MEKAYDKEHMRMAMLKHEETFREQVCELHRLYQIQKMLMESVRVGKQSKTPKQERELWNISSLDINRNDASFIDQKISSVKSQSCKLLELKADQEQYMVVGSHVLLNNNNNSRSNSHMYVNHGIVDDMDKSEIELTLGPSSFNNARRKAEDDSAGSQSVSSSSTGSSRARSYTTPIALTKISNTTAAQHCQDPLMSKRQYPWSLGQATTATSPAAQSTSLQNAQQTNPSWLCPTLTLKLT